MMEKGRKVWRSEVAETFLDNLHIIGYIVTQEVGRPVTVKP